MSKLFPTIAARAKNIQWLSNKSTKPTKWVERGVEEYLQVVQKNYPELIHKVIKVGQVKGNPHPTPHRKGPNDPFHGSEAIGQSNLERGDRDTSLHVYLDGVVKPANEEWPTLKVNAASADELGEDEVWLDPRYCEDYTSGKTVGKQASEDKKL